MQMRCFVVPFTSGLLVCVWVVALPGMDCAPSCGCDILLANCSPFEVAYLPNLHWYD